MKKKIVMGLILAGFLLKNTAIAYAAPVPMPDGTLFDAVYYAQAYPDVTAEIGTDADALYNHYITHGRAEGRLPAAPAALNQTAADFLVFDAIYYAQTYPDVAAAVGTDAGALYNHYINHGRAEGRLPGKPDISAAAAIASAPRKASVLNNSAVGNNPYFGKVLTVPGSSLAVDWLPYPDGFALALGNGTVLQYNSLAGISGGYVTATITGSKLSICYDFLVSADGNEFHRLSPGTEYLFFIRDASTGETAGIFKNAAANGRFTFPENNGSQTFDIDDASQVWLVDNIGSPLPNGSYFVTVGTASTSSLVASNIFTVAR